jgi:hypothetical protein
VAPVSRRTRCQESFARYGRDVIGDSTTTMMMRRIRLLLRGTVSVSRRVCKEGVGDVCIEHRLDGGVSCARTYHARGIIVGE